MKMGGERIRKLCGDGLQVQLDSNDCVLEVTGDGCRITMAKNCGRVRVVGDGCHLRIAHNIGDIEYTGDGGQVQLGPKSKDNVRYIGDGGKVTFGDASARREKTRKSPANPRPKDNASPEEQQNLMNEEKEARNRSRKSGSASPKTRIITTLDCDGHQVVRKWFISPSSVIKSFDGGHSTDSTCGRAKTSP